MRDANGCRLRRVCGGSWHTIKHLGHPKGQQLCRAVSLDADFPSRAILETLPPREKCLPLLNRPSDRRSGSTDSSMIFLSGRSDYRDGRAQSLMIRQKHPSRLLGSVLETRSCQHAGMVGTTNICCSCRDPGRDSARTTRDSRKSQSLQWPQVGMTCSMRC